jgi:hypothetical protein
VVGNSGDGRARGRVYTVRCRRRPPVSVSVQVELFHRRMRVRQRHMADGIRRTAYGVWHMFPCYITAAS